MIIEKILKQLTPERIKKEVEAVQKTNLPPEIQQLLREYKKVSQSDRKEYVWKWLYRTANIVILPTIEKKYRKSLANIKFLIFFFTGLLDDIADKNKLQNKKLLKELLKVPFNATSIQFGHLNQKEKTYIKFALKVFKKIGNTFKKYPRYKEFEEILAYDITQLLNTIKYSYLVNRNLYLINKTEYWLYMPHNMTVMINITIDLMCSPKFNIRHLGKLRELCWEIQKIMRIANWLGTWEREIYDSDFTSQVFGYAIDEGIITSDDFQKKDKSNIISKIKSADIEKSLLKEWEKIYWKIDRMNLQKSIIKSSKKISEMLLIYHLSSGTTRDL